MIGVRKTGVRDETFVAYISSNGKTKIIGRYKTEIEAHKAYLLERVKTHIKKVGGGEIDRGIPTGVYELPNKAGYKVYISIKNQTMFLGNFDTLEKAIEVRKEAEAIRDEKYKIRLTHEDYKQMLKEVNKIFPGKPKKITKKKITGIRKLGNGRYTLRVSLNGKQTYIGTYDTRAEAEVELMKIKKKSK